MARLVNYTSTCSRSSGDTTRSSPGPLIAAADSNGTGPGTSASQFRGQTIAGGKLTRTAADKPAEPGSQRVLGLTDVLTGEVRLSRVGNLSSCSVATPRNSNVVFQNVASVLLAVKANVSTYLPGGRMSRFDCVDLGFKVSSTPPPDLLVS